MKKLPERAGCDACVRRVTLTVKGKSSLGMGWSRIPTELFKKPTMSVYRSLRGALAFAIVSHSHAQIVINEIHYDPADETSPEEFVELHNPGVDPVDVSGWHLANAVDFTIPPSTEIPAGGFLVISENPTVLLSKYGASSVGPWQKGLGNEGETVELLDAAGGVVDEVRYQSGFPWPTGARGGGGSIELIHPSLDNDLGGSWRTSGTVPGTPDVILIPENSTGWKWRSGETEASTPTSAWRQNGFAEDGSWADFQAPIGYGSVSGNAGTLGLNTSISGMQFNYSCIFLRKTFTLPTGGVPSALKIRYSKDDGMVIWINGTLVAQANMSTSEPTISTLAATDSDPEGLWYEQLIPDASSFLQEGVNTVAVQVCNGSLESSDLGFDMELAEPGNPETLPITPGSRNSVWSVSAPPQIRQVAHSPTSPASEVPVVVTTKVTDPDGVDVVTLRYQTVDPGSYIRKTDSAYETSWSSVDMVDDGSGGDALAGDDVYTATLPASVQVHRRLVRYRIEARDAEGVAVAVPYADDEQPNFAYFVHDGFPDWSGSFAPGVAAETYPSSMMDDLPVYQVIANESDVMNSQYNGGFDGVQMWGTLVYDGVVYDHIGFENRGEASTYVSGKNKWRFHFNRARRFQARDDWGKKYPSTWNELNLNACASPWAAVNRGMAGLDEAISFRLYDLAGVPSSRTNYLSLRIVDSAAETNPANQYDSDLWGLYLAVEQPGGAFLDDRGLADGNLYKIEGGNGDKKEQGNTQVTDASDWYSFYNSSNSGQTEQWWRDHMDMPVYYSMRAMNRLAGNVDIRIGYNHYFYHEPATERWVVMPWDLDMMFIPETHQAGFIRQQNSVASHPQLALEFRNRCREISDLMASDPSVSGGQIGQLIDEYAQMVNPSGEAKTWADIDAALWNYHPRTSGNPNDHGGQSSHKGNFYYSPYFDTRIGGNYVRTLVSQDHEGFVRHILDYTTDTFPGENWGVGNGVPAGYGFEYLRHEAADAEIPDTPVVTFVGDPGFPTTGLSFECSPFSDPNGNGTFGKMRWRIAEIAAPGVGAHVPGEPRKYEMEAVHEQESSVFNAGYTFPTSVVVPGGTYRVRVRHEDATGRTSHWSSPVEFVASGADVATLVENLVVSEIHYHPADPTGAELELAASDTEFEFIELMNISGTLTLDLSSLSFTDGIEFDFATSSLTSLGPGERLVLVANQAAFEARYGSGLPVAGVYSGALSNGGENITISYAVTTPVIDFAYDDALPWPMEPDGGGVSLVLADPDSAPDPSLAESWVSGSVLHGTPGTGESTPPTFAGWRQDHFSEGEGSDPSISGPDADPDGDGLSNFLEFALGLDPRVSDAAGAVVGGKMEDGGESYFSLTFRRRIDRGNLLYQVEKSDDLAIWTALSGVETMTQDNLDGTETVTVRSDAPLGAGPEFLRLKVAE